MNPQVNEQTGHECRVIPFPLASRTALLREVAGKLAAKRTAHTADAYRGKVADRLFRDLNALGVSESEQDEVVGAFFDRIDDLLDRDECQCMG